MKNPLLFYALPLLLSLIIIAGCEKEEEKKNYFALKGKSYSINETYLFKLVFEATDENPQLVIYQFIFDHIKDGDTTSLYLAAVDYNDATLGGEYLSRDINSDEPRGIFPNLFVAGSAVFLPDGDVYLTGGSGKFAVEKDVADYSLKFTNIEAGDYDEDGNFLPYGKITGNFNGLIYMSVRTLNDVPGRQEKLKSMLTLQRDKIRYRNTGF